MDKESSIQSIYNEAFDVEFEKIAKSRYMKELGKALSKGKYNKAEDLIYAGTQGYVSPFNNAPDLRNLRAFVAHGGVKNRKGYKSATFAKGKGFDVSDDSIMAATRRGMRDAKKLGDKEPLSSRLRTHKRSKEFFREKKKNIKTPNLSIKGSSYVTHAGNSQHMGKFLKGGNSGGRIWMYRQQDKPVKVAKKYAVENSSEFNKSYKIKSVQRYGGTPATLTAKVDNTYIKRPWRKGVEHSDEYVVLPSKNAGKLKDVNIKKEYLPGEQAISGIGDKSKGMAETLEPFKWGGGLVKK